jgi:redox-sensitive bicupin YhaK (pirin superfamily)
MPQPTIVFLLIALCANAQRIIQSRSTKDGDNAIIYRSIGSDALPDLDPFLLLDEFHVYKPAGFPAHPHRGFETLTYMLKGSFHHSDHLGESGEISRYGVQWMKAGRGIIHSEMPGDEGDNCGLQIWINLHSSRKLDAPQYKQVRASPRRSSGNIRIRTIAGLNSSIQTTTSAYIQDVSLKRNALQMHESYIGWNCWVYAVEGEISVSGRLLRKRELYYASDVSELECTSDIPSRYVIGCGERLNEVISRRGPFVMNSASQLHEAEMDYMLRRNGFSSRY